MRFSSKSRAACFYCTSLDLLICIIFYGDQITCRCWNRQSADVRHAKSKSGAANLHGAGAFNLTDNTIGLNNDKIGETPNLHTYSTPAKSDFLDSNPTMKIVLTLPFLPHNETACLNAFS